MRKSVLMSFGAVAVLALALASPAWADPPSRTFVPAFPFFGPSCPNFLVGVTPLNTSQYSLVFNDGGSILTGSYFPEVTNLSTGKSLVVNSGGPEFFSADGSVITARGETLVTFTADFPTAGRAAT